MIIHPIWIYLLYLSDNVVEMLKGMHIVLLSIYIFMMLIVSVGVALDEVNKNILNILWKNKSYFIFSGLVHFIPSSKTIIAMWLANNVEQKHIELLFNTATQVFTNIMDKF